MKFSSGQRVGQSGQELATAVSFSLFLHVAFFLAAFLLFTVTPRVFIPPFYSVKLVGLPSEAGAPVQVPGGGAPHAPEKHAAKPAPMQKAKKPAERYRAASPKTHLPELSASKSKPAKTEPAKPAEAPAQPHSTAAPPSREAPAAGSSGEGVAVATSQSDFKFGWYLERIRDKISQNWNPPRDAAGAKARVVFSVNRSGWLGNDVNLVLEQSNGSFGFKQAAVRAVRASNPFPPLPEEFSKQTLEFTVDLIPVD